MRTSMTQRLLLSKHPFLSLPYSRRKGTSSGRPPRGATKAAAKDDDVNEETSSFSPGSNLLRTSTGGGGVGTYYQTGDVIKEEYVVKDLLGTGSYGETLLCEHLVGNVREEVALKVLPWESLKKMSAGGGANNDASPWKALDSFERESKVLQSIDYETIPKYVEHFEIEKGTKSGDLEFVLVQKVAKGKSLTELVESGTWRPSEPFVKKMLVQLLETVSYLETLRPPVWHRDITPNNVIVDMENETISLVDFGAVAESAVSGGMEMTRVGTSVGTFGYAAPEQLQGRVGKKSDQYGVGSTILFAMSGCPPSAFPSERLKIAFRESDYRRSRHRKVS